METELSPKYTEMKTGERTSRFGRPQKAAQQEINSIPTEVMKFIPKHSPKRLKPKVDLDTSLDLNSSLDLDSSLTEETPRKQSTASDIPTENQDIPSHNKENLENTECEIAGDEEVKLVEPMDQSKSEESPETLPNTPLMITEETLCEADPSVTMPISEDQKLSDGNDDLNDEDHHEATENHSDGISDTDSALGSAVSCNDTKDEEVTLGQVLWGSFNRQSWWPCIVYPIDETGAFSAGKSSFNN